MKNFLAIFSSALLLIAILFKVMHWPGSDTLLITSFGILLPLYFLFALISEWREGQNKILSILFFFSVFIFLIGILFRSIHWYGGDLMLIVSCASFGIYQLLKAFSSNKKDFLTIPMAFAHSILLIGVLFLFMHWPGSDVIRPITFLTLIVIVIINLISISKDSSKIQLDSMRGFLLVVIISGIIYLRYNSFIPPSAFFNTIYSYNELQDKNETEVSLGNVYFKNKTNSSNQIDLETKKLIEQLDNAKYQILQHSTSDIRLCIVQDRDEKNPLLPFRVDLTNVDDKFDQDTPIMTMVGGDLIAISSKSEGIKIWNAYNDYRSKVVDILGTYEESGNKFRLSTKSINNFESSEDLDKQIRTMMTSGGNNVNKEDLDVMVNIYKLMTKKEYDYYQEMDDIHWVARTFYHTTVIDAVRILTQLQNEVLTVRTLALSHLSSKSLVK
jgi:hypothetical protein